MGKQTPMGSWCSLPSCSQALFSAPVVPKKVESEPKKSDDDSEAEATDGVALGVGGWVGGVGMNLVQNGGLVREIPEKFRET